MVDFSVKILNVPFQASQMYHCTDDILFSSLTITLKWFKEI